MQSLYIIKVGTTFPELARQFGDFEDWTRQGMGLKKSPIRIVDPRQGDRLPVVDECTGVVVTGSHEMVTDCLPWSMALERWIPSVLAAGVPFLGICYGHQLLAKAMGGVVAYHPNGSEAGTVAISLLPACADDELFSGLPESMHVHAVHAQTVLQLPPEAVRLAGNAFEPNHAFRLGSRAWGVQFHPEYDERIMLAYLEAEELTAKDVKAKALFQAVRPTPHAALLLPRFRALAEKNPLSLAGEGMSGKCDA